MRIQIVSDLHLEHRGSTRTVLDVIKPCSDTILIMAGDITVLKWYDQAKRDIEELIEGYKHAFWVLGNHEFWGGSVAETWNVALALQMAIPGLTLLTANKPVVYDGHRFIGDTMWFKHQPENDLYKQLMDDFNVISGFEPWVYDECNATLRGFESNMQPGDIVVTHHLPSYMSVHPRFAMSVLNRFFVCNVEQLILDKEPALWIHGHSHHDVQYNIGKTKVLSNPLGYPNERTTFNPQLVLDI